MYRYIILTCMIFFITNAVGSSDVEPSPLIVYETQGDFDDIKEDIEMAIIDRGLLVSGTLHISDMLNRTGSDLGYQRPVYHRAESIEFCSASVSHLMVSTHPANAAICPFTIAIYSLAADPEKVYLVFRRLYLAGEAEKVSQVVFELMDSIVRDVIE